MKWELHAWQGSEDQGSESLLSVPRTEESFRCRWRMPAQFHLPESDRNAACGFAAGKRFPGERLRSREI